MKGLPTCSPTEIPMSAVNQMTLLGEGKLHCSFADTGGRGGITQGVSFEFFKSFLIIYSHNTHWVNFGFFQKLLTTLIKTYSLGNF